MIPTWGTSTGNSLPIVPGPTTAQLIASFCAFPNARIASTTTNLWNQVRQGHVTGRWPVSNIQIVASAARILSGSGDEMPLGNPLTLEYAYEVASPASSTAFLWGGVTPGALLDNTNQASDVMAVTILNDTQFFTRARMGVATVGQFFLDNDKVGLATQGIQTGASSQLLNTGALNTSGAVVGGSTEPSMIIGFPANGLSSVCLVGDSIGDGKNDGNTPTQGGYYPRAMNAIRGHVVPWHRQAVQASTLNAAQPPISVVQEALWPYVTDLIIQLGTNDIASAATLATLQTRFTAIATAGTATIGPYGKPLRVHALSILPRASSSSDLYETAAGQTIENGFEVGGIRDQYNAWLQAQVGTMITGYCDISPGAEDPLNHGKWITNGTANYPTLDGIHPQPILHQNIAPILASYFSNYLNP